MPRRFVTEKDMEEFFRQGKRSLEVTADMALTDLAYEKARQRGIQLIDGRQPSAPERPYLVQNPVRKQAEKAAKVMEEPVAAGGLKLPLDLSGSGLNRQELHKRIRTAVMRKLSGQLDPQVVETIIQRILDSTGVR
ncbi:MAG TPA: hypothetical protein VLH85_06150 [Levilinea sp.]|nr:hypothetical protein [Levilinea sp.]